MQPKNHILQEINHYAFYMMENKKETSNLSNESSQFLLLLALLQVFTFLCVWWLSRGGSAEIPKLTLTTKLGLKLQFHPGAACVTDPVQIPQGERA